MSKLIINEDATMDELTQTVLKIVEDLPGCKKANNGDLYFENDFFYDYKLDTKTAYDIVSSDYPTETFNDLIMDDSYSDWYLQCQDEVMEQVREKLPDIDDYDLEEIISENVSFEVADMSVVYDCLIPCRLIINNGDSSTDFAENPCYSDIGKEDFKLSTKSGIYWLVKQLGLDEHKLENAIQMSDPTDLDSVSNSIYEEIENTTGSLNALTFAVQATLSQLLDIKENRKPIKLASGVTCGLFGLFEGGGSTFEIQINISLTVPTNLIYEFVPDVNTSQCYSIDDVYGVSSNFYTKIEESVEQPKQPLQESASNDKSIDILKGFGISQKDISNLLDVCYKRRIPFNMVVSIIQGDIASGMTAQEAYEEEYNSCNKGTFDDMLPHIKELDTSEMTVKGRKAIQSIQEFLKQQDMDVQIEAEYRKDLEDQKPGYIPLQITLCGEYDYEEMDNICSEVEPILNKYDRDAYFEGETPGRFTAICWNLCKKVNESVNIKKDILDEGIGLANGVMNESASDDSEYKRHSLCVYITNTKEIYDKTKLYIDNLAKKKASGKFDKEKAIKGFETLIVKSAITLFNKEEQPSKFTFTEEDKRYVAEWIFGYYLEDIEDEAQKYTKKTNESLIAESTTKYITSDVMNNTKSKLLRNELDLDKCSILIYNDKNWGLERNRLSDKAFNILNKEMEILYPNLTYIGDIK